MSNVLIEKNTIDLLANAISDKSGVPVTMTLGEMIEAVDSIEAGSAEPVLQTKTATYTPSTTAVTDTVTADSGYDGLEEVDVTVNAVPMATVSNTDVSQILINGYDFDSSTGKFFSWSEVEDFIQPITQDGYISTGTNIVIYGSTAESEYQLTTRSSSDLTASGATVSVPSGYYASQASKAVSSGSATPASTISATGASVSTGTNTLTLSKSVSNTPTVSAGYVSSGTAGNSSVSLTASVTTQAAQTIYPSTSDQTISASRYLTGAQTIKAVTTSNLTAENIKSGVTITVGDSADADRVASVTGTYTGGGGGGVGTLLTTYSMGTISTTSTQATDTGKSISVSSVNNYDLLIVETSVNTVTNNRHTATVGLIFLTASSTVGTKNGASVATVKWNSKISSSAVTTTRAGTTAYGIYPNSCSVATSNNVTTATIPMYQRYNSTSTGTINGTYTARVYGVNLYDLIGG